MPNTKRPQVQTVPIHCLVCAKSAEARVCSDAFSVPAEWWSTPVMRGGGLVYAYLCSEPCLVVAVDRAIEEAAQ